ncbi:hypothetical protein D9M69_602930 [compost metagenome]
MWLELRFEQLEAGFGGIALGQFDLALHVLALAEAVEEEADAGPRDDGDGDARGQLVAPQVEKVEGGRAAPGVADEVAGEEAEGHARHDQQRAPRPFRPEGLAVSGDEEPAAIDEQPARGADRQ